MLHDGLQVPYLNLPVNRSLPKHKTPWCAVGDGFSVCVCVLRGAIPDESLGCRSGWCVRAGLTMSTLTLECQSPPISPSIWKYMSKYLAPCLPIRRDPTTTFRLDFHLSLPA